METQVHEVKALEKEVNDLHRRLDEATNLLKRKRKQLQEDCENSEEGHDYICERTFDYHSSYNSYTCDKCGHYTMMRPKKFKPTPK
jgi:ribosomal protein L40E